MRKMLILLAIVYLVCLVLAVAADARTYMTAKHKVKHHVVSIHKTKAVKAKACVTKHRKMVRRYAPRAGAGPVVKCPAPVVNVPAQAAPVVNVPQQPAPVVNVPAPPATVGITVDNCNIYIVRENQLLILDKNTMQVKQTVPLGSP